MYYVPMVVHTCPRCLICPYNFYVLFLFMWYVLCVLLPHMSDMFTWSICSFLATHRGVQYFRPLNSHSFTLCHTVSLPFSRSRRRFFISCGFTNIKQIFSQLTVFLKSKHKQHIPMLLKTYPSLINKNKISSRSSLSELVTIVHYVSEDRYW